MVFVMNSPTFSQQTKQISELQILHDHNWIPFEYRCIVNVSCNLTAVEDVFSE